MDGWIAYIITFYSTLKQCDRIMIIIVIMICFFQLVFWKLTRKKAEKLLMACSNLRGTILIRMSEQTSHGYSLSIHVSAIIITIIIIISVIISSVISIINIITIIIFIIIIIIIIIIIVIIIGVMVVLIAIYVCFVN